MPPRLGPMRASASLPTMGGLAVSSSCTEAPVGLQEKPSHAGPLFELELDVLATTTKRQDRCMSQVFAAEHTAASQGTSLLQQVLSLCRCSSPVQAQLLQQVQRLRTAADAASPAGSAAGGSGHSSDAAACVLAPPPPLEAPHIVSCRTLSGQPGVDERAASALDISAMACELLAQGYMVQVRESSGAQQQERSKTPRSCLQSLRHKFIVCLGVRSDDDEVVYLPQPLVVEPRLRETFAIAHSTPQYEALLQSIPQCFVGPVSNLEAVVQLVCEEMKGAFKLQGLPTPPWRTRTALLSQWDPPKLIELSNKIASLRRLAAATPAPGASRAMCMEPCQSHDRLYNGDRPAAAHADHAAVGSAPTSAAVETLSSSLSAGAATAAFNSAAQPDLYSHGPAAAHHAGSPSAVWRAAVQVAGGSSTGQPSAVNDVQQAPLAAPIGCLEAVPGLGSGVGMGYVAAPAGEQPNAAVLALLAANANSGAAASAAGGAAGAALFTRKASAEWKHQRSTGRNIKGLLAAALNKSAGVSSCNHTAPPDRGASSVPAGGVSASSFSALQQQQQLAAAAADLGPTSDALIRRTHFRAACDEPWRRITTVRLGALSQQQQQHAQQQHHQQQQPKQ